jgi:hypothetical protein
MHGVIYFMFYTMHREPEKPMPLIIWHIPIIVRGFVHLY